MDVIYLIEQEGKIRGLSPRTIESYSFCIKKFFEYTKKDPRKICKKDIKKFVAHLTDRGLAGTTISLYVNSLKFLLQEILAKRVTWNIRHPKKAKTLPTVLTQKEITRLLKVIENKKHQLMIELLYSAGLRVSELVNLKLEHLEIEEGMGWVRQGKGKKDRIFILAKTVIPKIRYHLYENNIEEGYLFLGRKGRHLHTRSVQEMVKKAAKKAKIIKNVHPHTLRHSFATHLVENGYDITTVQQLLGHSSLQTTTVYIHIASPKLLNVKSPLDTLLNP